MRIVVAGAGVIGQAHIDRILREPRASLAGIVDVTAQAEARAESLHVPFAANIDDMLAAVRPDGIVIALPNQMHFPAAMAAVRAGIPMLIEKPVCETVAEALELAAAAEAAGVATLVGHHRRHSAILGRAKEMLGTGRLGRLVAVNAFCWLLKPSQYFEGAGSWRRQPGGGPVMINLIHTIDDLRNLCGEITTVQAAASSHARGFAVEDTAGVILQFQSGVIATLTLSDTAAGPWSWELTSGENAVYSRTEESCYFLAGTSGALSIPGLAFWHHGEAGHWHTPVQSEHESVVSEDPLSKQMRHFCDVVRGAAKPVLDARGAAKTLAAALAVREAANSGRAVALA